MNDPKQTNEDQRGDGSELLSTELLGAFMEEYEWVRDCMKEMEERPDVYNECDHHGLPYCMLILKSIAEKANISLT